MKIITTHLSADFDAFAGAVCAVRLYPDHRVLFPGSQELAVRRFLSATGVPYPEIKLREARPRTWQHAVVIDTRHPSRLGEAWDLISRDGCPVTLIDHHVMEEDALGADEVVSMPVGATCTIIASLLRDRGVAFGSEEASLLLMGIYEDTGGLSYRETTPEDLRIVAWLLEQGGTLDWVRRWVLKGLQPDQFELLNQIVESAEEFVIHDVPVVMSMVTVDRYHEEAAYVVHRWVETFEIPVGIVMLVRPPHVNLIMRSRLQDLHVGQLARHFGGGGHATAASARISSRMPVELREELLAMLDKRMPPPVSARDIATGQLFSVESETSVELTKERVNQLRINAVPVSQGEGGELVGVVTRQILDRALSHGLGERPVSAVMQPGVPIVPGSTPLADLRDLFLERSYRFVIVEEEEGRPRGLITRMELLRRLFERQSSAGAALDHRMAGERPVRQSVVALMREVALPWVGELLERARTVADRRGVRVYLVGGAVRDMMLGRPSEDIDLVVEGDGIAFGRDLCDESGGRCHPHEPFLTAVVTLADGGRIDVASARTEFYRTPAALPEVETSLIRQDLYRRDFTINALAVVLGGERHGELVDFFGGRKDLRQGEIRVLHSLSFIDDPTRAIRAVRYARRLGFEIAPDTRNLIETAVQEGIFEKLSGQRLRRELELLLVEPHPARSIVLMAELGLLPVLVPGLQWSEELRSFLFKVEGQVAWYSLEHLGDPPEAWVLYLGALVLHAGDGAGGRLARRLQVGGQIGERLSEVRSRVEELRRDSAESERRSQRVQCVDRQYPEVLLLAMAGVDLSDRRFLADAAVASQRLQMPVRGSMLLEAGIDQGPHIGEALNRSRDALLDGEITAEQALDFALAQARGLAALAAEE